MSTDIYGFIEARHPPAHENRYEGDPCTAVSIPLHPLYDDQDYESFACLFGVRDRLGWVPVAAGRGLPDDVSEPVRADYEDAARLDAAVHGCTWISWAELRDVDMTVRPAARGMLRLRPRQSSSIHLYRIDDRWPEELVRRYPMPPLDAAPSRCSAGCTTHRTPPSRP
ncbi:hypothetical protein [Nonomuraea sp. NPDC052265]|uniref:hypothetical protein n=1 Tax=Nonomuraea sp. NPDC052265 TaxID=3364374 RepID=UPI0037CB1AE3